MNILVRKRREVQYAKRLLLFKSNIYRKENIDKDIEDLNTCVVMYDFFFNSFMNLLVIQDSEEKEALLEALLNAQVAFDADDEKYNKEKIQYEKIKSVLKELNSKKLQPSKKPC